MNKTAYIKLAEVYLEDVDQALKTAAVHGFMGLDYSEEKLASFKWLLLNLDGEEVQALDKTASETLDAMEKVAFLGALLRGGAGVAGKALGWGGKALGAIGGKASQFAVGASQPSKNFMQFLTKRRGADFAADAAQQIQGAGGLRGWVQQRRMAERFMRGVPGTGTAAGLKAAPVRPDIGPIVPAAAAARGSGKPAARELAPAGAAGSRWGELWKQTKSGLLWGGGFGLASRLLSPPEQPEYRFVGQN